jgi:AcrR family transcriptional regulator
MFAERGFVSTTVRDIADEAGILSGSLYHHFDSKESMADAILRAFLDPTLARYREILAEGRPPRDTLEALVSSSLSAMEGHRSAIIMYQNEARLFAQIPRFSYLREVALEFRKIWIGVLEQGIRSGDFRATIDTELVYRLIRDTVWGAPRWFRPKGDMTFERLTAQYLDVLLDGIAKSRS